MKTTSLELTKKLNNLGVKTPGATSDTEFYFYTLDEILDMLPLSFYHDVRLYVWIIIRNTDKEYEYTIRYETVCHQTMFDGVRINCVGVFSHSNPAEAAGNLLAWCIENGHVKVEDL